MNGFVGADVAADLQGRRARATCKDSQADITKARTLLGYAPIVGLEEGLRRTLEWCRADRRARAAGGEPLSDAERVHRSRGQLRIPRVTLRAPNETAQVINNSYDPLYPADRRAGSAEAGESAEPDDQRRPDLRLHGDAVGLERRSGVVHRLVQLREALDVRRRIRRAGERRRVEIEAAVLNRRALPPLFFLGALLGLIGLSIYFAGILFAIVRFALPLGHTARAWNEAIVWYSGVPCTLGLLLAALDLAFLLPVKRKGSRRATLQPVGDRTVVVALTAFNDEQSIGAAVTDFRRHPSVRNVLVVDNNSTDRTSAEAARAGAVVVMEPRQGYGWCVYRCFQEALAGATPSLIVLCEGDRTFRAGDLDKLLAYIDHADIVNGTRIVEQLREVLDTTLHIHVLRQLRGRETARAQTSGTGHIHGRWHDV